MKTPRPASNTPVEQRSIDESCIACHACCHHLVLRLKPQDLGRCLKTALTAEEYEPNKFRLMPRKKPGECTGNQCTTWDFYCPFLFSTGHCSIYDDRPDACRIFKRGSQACHAQRRLYRHGHQS